MAAQPFEAAKLSDAERAIYEAMKAKRAAAALGAFVACIASLGMVRSFALPSAARLSPPGSLRANVVDGIAAARGCINSRPVALVTPVYCFSKHIA